MSEVLQQRLVPAIVSFAVADPSMTVKKAAVSSLTLTAADAEAAQVLDSMDAASFSQVARELSPELLPAALRPRIVVLLQEFLETAVTPWERLRTVLKLIELGEPDLAVRLKTVLDDISTDEVEKHGHHIVREALDLLRLRDPDWVSQWVAARIADGGLWPYHWIALVSTVSDDLAERILQRLENEDFEHTRFDGIIALLTVAANQKLAARLFSRLKTLRAAVVAGPDQRHDFEWAVERQLEALFHALPVDAAIAGVLASVADPPDAIDVQVTTRLLTRVARSDLEPIAGLDPGLKAAMRGYLKKSISVTLAEEDFTGAQKANLASSIAQVGEPGDLADLVTLIRADIERVRKGRAARATGDRGPRAEGASASYATWHLSALVHLDGGGATDVLVELLREPDYRDSVAEAMARSTVWAEKPLVDRNRSCQQMWDAREGRLVPTLTDQRKRYAAALTEQIHRLLGDRKGEPGSTYTLMRLANALAAVGGTEAAKLVLKVLLLPEGQQDWERVEAAERMLASGVALPTTEAIALVEAVLERRQKYGSDGNDRWLIRRYLHLLPFVDDPPKGIQKLRELVAKARFAPYEYRDVITALGESRSDAALDVLKELGSNPKDMEQYEDEWINAVTRLATPAARELLLSLVDPTLPGIGVEIKLRWHDIASLHIAEIAKRRPEVEAQLRRLVEADLPPLKRLRLAAVLNAIGTPACLSAGLRLIDDHARPSVPQHTFDHIEATFVERRPSGQPENSYTLSARAANDVRMTLFEMAIKDSRRQKAAFSLLGKIEEWRLEYGRPTSEPRHPSFESGEPWPPNEPVA